MLIPLPTRILVATAPVDFRKSIDGLAAVAEVELRESPLNGTLFVFTNRRRDALKLLVWHQGGFVLVYKRLERGRFRLLPTDQDRRTISPAELTAIFEGLDIRLTPRLPRWNPTNLA